MDFVVGGDVCTISPSGGGVDDGELAGSCWCAVHSLPLEEVMCPFSSLSMTPLPSIDNYNDDDDDDYDDEEEDDDDREEDLRLGITTLWDIITSYNRQQKENRRSGLMRVRVVQSSQAFEDGEAQFM